jgi:integrase
MPPKPPPWTIEKRRGSRCFRVRFSYQGCRFEESTRTSDVAEAQKRAAQLYASVVTGEHQPRVRLLANANTPVDELGSLWLSEQDYTDGPWLTYLRHWQDHFKTFDALCRPGAIAGYWESRLRNVLWQTVNKECGPLRDLLDWCERKGLLTARIEVPALPSRKKRANRGTPFRQRRRGKATELTAEQARALVALLPEYSTSKKDASFPIRARFAVMLETGLRPKTLDQLRAPEHYTKGAAVLRVTADIDKSEYARELPLTDEARAALDSACPSQGLIFGKHDYRPQLSKAAGLALPPHLAATFTAYDFRHRCATELAATGDLTGAAYLMGHKQVTTLNRYAKPQQSAAARVLAARSRAIGAVTWGRNQNGRLSAAAGLSECSMIPMSCEGEDSNLHGSYPASTSS